VTAPLKIMLVAGEPSGDALGAGLARALRARLGPDGVRFVGVGGPRMAAEGVPSPFDIAELSLFGLVELFASARRVYRRIDQTVALALAEQPDAVVLIDAWGFTVRVAKRLRRRAPRLPLVKYVAPQVWASRAGRTRELARVADHVLTLFAFEPPLFEAVGLPATFVGNPVLSRDPSGADPARLRAAIGAADKPILLLLPGSRRGEVERLLPRFEAAVSLLKADRPDLRLVIPVADAVADRVKAAVAGWSCPATIVEGEAAKYDAMAAATAALACSGTVTTELAMAGCPMVVAYRVAPVTAVVARIIVRTRFATLFNIAAGRAVAPELIQEACTGPALAAAVAPLLDDPRLREAQARAQAEALVKLGRGVADPAEKAADVVLQVIADARKRA